MSNRDTIKREKRQGSVHQRQIDECWESPAGHWYFKTKRLTLLAGIHRSALRGVNLDERRGGWRRERITLHRSLTGYSIREQNVKGLKSRLVMFPDKLSTEKIELKSFLL